MSNLILPQANSLLSSGHSTESSRQSENVEKNVTNTPTNIKSIVLQICSKNSRLGRAQIDEFLLSILMKEFTLETWDFLHEYSSFVKIYELSFTRYTCPVLSKFASIYHKSQDAKSDPPEQPLSDTAIVQLTPQSKITFLGDCYHAILVLDINRGVNSVGEKVLTEVLFKRLFEFWTVLCNISSTMNINVWVSILLDFGSTENSPAYICCYDSPQLCDFRIIVEKLTPHIQTVDQYFPPSKFPKILTCALQCSNYKKSCTTFLIIFTSGILDLSFCPDYESQLQAFTALNIPIYTCLLDTSINCFGLVPETDVFQYFARTTGGKCSSHFEFSAPFFSDRSYVRTSQKQFSIETFPLSNTQLAFPWDPSVSIPIFCVPTRYREYEVSCPMDIIKARLRQGFMVQSVLYKSKIIIQLVLHWFSEVCVHYRLKIALDWSFARVEINVLAFSEFTLNLFKHPSHISNSLEVSSFQEFLRSLIDQDLVYKVLMETSVNSTGYNFQGNKDSYPQLIETFLRTHINWMDEYTIYLCCSKKSFLCIVEAWAKCNISEHYVYYDVDNAYFAFTALHLDEATDFYIVCHVLYYKIKSLPSELDKIFSYDGTVSVIHGPNIQLNRSLLKHTSHVYTVSSDLSYKMATISLDHFSELGYKALRSFPTSVDMVMENLQATITFHENSMSIDTYQLPKLRRTDLKQLTDKLSAMYTLGCLLDKKLPSSDPIFSIPNLLRHSNLTILGFHNKVQVPIHAFSKTLRKHVSEMCMDRPLPYSLDYEAFHNAIHQWHGMTPPICSQFESYIYISTYSVFVLHLPRHTNVPYILLFECIMNLMSLRNWASIELSPHCFGPMQKMYPLVTTFYYTSYHITTENMDLFLCDCAWQSTVECIYSLSHQLHPSHVELCIQQLSTWTITLEISLLICLFEVLHFDQSRNHSELIQSECSRFNKCVHQFMRIIPDTHYFTVLEPFIFATVSSFQSQPETCGKNLISCPTSPPLGDIDYDEEQKKAMLKEYVYPYPIQLRLSYFGLERDTTQVSSLARSMSKSLERVIKQIVLNLFLSMDPITERILDIILNELNVLDKTEFRLNVLKAASVSLIITELERFDFNGFTITRVGPYLLLLVQLNPNNMDDLDMTAITSADIEQSRELDEGDLNSLQEKETSSVASNKISGKQQKSWIILSVETEVLHVYSNVPHIREIIELMLPKLYRIVNTRVLLNQLRDSHSSSRYLIPFEENENGEEGLLQSDKDGKDAEEILDASLGEFACPIQFSFSFPIHWRLKPMVSLNSVSASLHSLSVTNRAHTFVFISNEGCIYYMLLKEVSVPSASNAVAATVMNEEESTSFSSPNMYIPPNTGPVVPNSFSATRNLVLELHGLDPVSKEFSDEVVNMVSSRLSNVILHHLSTYLSRTTLCRLTPADVHFLLPIFRGPKATFLLSDNAMYGIDETSILFFRQSLLTFTSVLCSNDVVTTIAQHLQLKYDVIFSMKENYEVAPFDMVFLYCSVSSRCPSALETSIGQGIACLLFYLSQDGKVTFQPNPETALYWCVEFWTHGAIHTQALFEKVQRCQLQSLHDLEIERELRRKVDISTLFSISFDVAPDHYSCLFVSRLPIRIASWRKKHLLDFLETNFSEFTFQRNHNSILCLLPCIEAQAWCFFSCFVNQWKSDKWIKVNVDRHFLFYVEIQKECVLRVCWNTKQAFLDKVDSFLSTYIENYLQHIKELQQMTLFKMGLRSQGNRNFNEENKEITYLLRSVEHPLPIPEQLAQAYLQNKVNKDSSTYQSKDDAQKLSSPQNIFFVPSIKGQKCVLDSTELDLMLTHSHLFYQCRAPLFINCTYHPDSLTYTPLPLIQPDLIKSSISTILDALMAEFRGHLFSMGFGLSHTKKEDSSFFLSNDVQLLVPRHYFQKFAYSECILLEVTFEKFFFCVHMYQCIISSTSSTSKYQFRPFTELCYSVRQNLHVAAFVYDFQLRHLVNVILDHLLPPYPLIHVLNELHQSSLPKEANGQLFRGVVVHPHAHIVTYLFSHPLRYGLNLVRANTNACYFLLNETSPTSLVVMRQTPQGMEYFILATDPSPRPYMSKNIHKKVNETTVMIDGLLEKASWYYEREKSWQSLLEVHDVEVSEILQLARNFFCTSLLTLDPTIQLLLSLPADWHEVAKILSSDWPFGLKRMSGPEQALFIIFFNQDDSALYMASFSPPQVTLVIRDKENKKHINALVSFFIMTLSRVLWRHLNMLTSNI